ncbi:allantoinase PuuE [uncultured Salinisphaera sp.]|uniref:allantoinase PuuE n=1 Tax=uncultured Salinisphaera sp. TaxID=359372 RepID=UPI0032B10D02
MNDYPRDMIGYGAQPPAAAWPGGARLALQFVINYEEGAENNILHGDAASESFLSEMVGTDARPGVRHMSMEWLYEYGSRAGVWRLLRLFRQRNLTATVFAVGMAAERHPDAVRALADAGFEIACHGWRWIDYQYVDEATERAHIDKAVAAIEDATGITPVGWYTGRCGPNTRRLVAEHGGFVYDADSYADDLPYWEHVPGVAEPQLIVPYTLDTNDMRFVAPQGFNSGEQFFTYLKDAFDMLYAEGATAPKMLSVGLHCRIAGRPARAAAVARFLDYVAGFDDVWVTTREAIARHWRDVHPYQSAD